MQLLSLCNSAIGFRTRSVCHALCCYALISLLILVSPLVAVWWYLDRTNKQHLPNSYGSSRTKEFITRIELAEAIAPSLVLRINQFRQVVVVGLCFDIIRQVETDFWRKRHRRSPVSVISS